MLVWGLACTVLARGQTLNIIHLLAACKRHARGRGSRSPSFNMLLKQVGRSFNRPRPLVFSSGDCAFGRAFSFCSARKKKKTVARQLNFEASLLGIPKLLGVNIIPSVRIIQVEFYFLSTLAKRLQGF